MNFYVHLIVSTLIFHQTNATWSVLTSWFSKGKSTCSGVNCNASAYRPSNITSPSKTTTQVKLSNESIIPPLPNISTYVDGYPKILTISNKTTINNKPGFQYTIEKSKHHLNDSSTLNKATLSPVLLSQTNQTYPQPPPSPYVDVYWDRKERKYVCKTGPGPKEKQTEVPCTKSDIGWLEEWKAGRISNESEATSNTESRINLPEAQSRLSGQSKKKIV